jgi:hypothetical protein
VIEIGLAGGTKLVLANEFAEEDEIVDAVLDNLGGVMSVRTEQGTYRVFADRVVYVRTIPGDA